MNMKIKIQAVIVTKGGGKKPAPIIEEIFCNISDPPKKKDTDKISAAVKKMFEKELCKLTSVKTRIKEEVVEFYITIKNDE
jgi:hypothetical protein